MNKPDGSHPDHDCENCGKTHFSYTFHKEQANKKKSRNIGIAIACISLILIPVSITVFDLIKDPQMLSNHIELQKMVDGYDLACYSENGMQYCLLQSTDDNYVNYNSEKIILQPKTNPCLNIYLETQDKITDSYIPDDVDCVSSLEFPIINHWSWSSLGTNIDVNELYEVTKSKQWWDRSDCQEDKFCNWWLDL